MSEFKFRNRLQVLLLASSFLVPAAGALADDANPSAAAPDGKTKQQNKQAADNAQVAADTQVAANTQVAAADRTITVETVVSTGTRAKDRTVADSEVPIDVVSTRDLAISGKLNLRDALQQTIPSYNNASGWTGGTGEAIKSASLRGLSSDQTLVLVNGVRRHADSVVFVTAQGNLGASPVDLDLIPESAVDHIEVLRDGASSQYGSDAIAGVINIVLKNSPDGGAASITYGQYATSAGRDNLGNDGHVTLEQGFELGNGGFFRISGDYDNHTYTNQLGPTAPCTTATRSLTCLYPAGDPRENTNTRYVGKQGLPLGYTYSLGYNAELPITSDITLFSFATASHQYSQNFGIFRPAASLQTLEQVYPNGYLPQFIVSTDDAQGVFGIKGTNLAGWDWKLSGSISDNVAKLHNNNDLNPSLGPTSPVNFRLGDIVSIELPVNLDLTREVDTGWFAAPLNVAVGAEFRYNKYFQTAGDPGSYQIGNYVFPSDPTDPNYSAANVGKHPSGGASGLGGFDPTALGHGSRTNTAAYIDLDQKVVDNLDIDIAGRYEHYSDVGDTVSGKASARYEFIPGYALRGSISNGFRAPSLQEEDYTSLLPNYVQNPANPSQQILSITRYIPATSPVARALGATPLKPEKSVDESVGFTAQPTDKINFTVDAYQIAIKDRILETGSLNNFVAGSAFQTAVAGAGGNPGDTFTYFTNAADTRTRGIDTVASYTEDYGDYGTVKYSIASAYTQQKVTNILPTPAILASAGLTTLGRQVLGNLTLAYPKNRSSFDVNWSIDRFTVDLRETWYSSTTYVAPLVAAQDSVNAPAVITDLAVSYAVTDALSVTAGGNNLLNHFPTQLNAAAQLNYGWWAQNPIYNQTSPYGWNGGFYYFRVNYAW
jgi:iron complex outermembrane recepter protein